KPRKIAAHVPRHEENGSLCARGAAVFSERHFGYALANFSASLSPMLHEFQKDQTVAHSPDEAPFRILAIYDSAKASAEAARASAVVVRELGDDVPVDRCSWNVSA